MWSEYCPCGHAHGFSEIDGVQDFDFIPGIREHLSALDNDRTLGVRYDIADLFGHLHQVGLDVKSCLTAATAADHDDVFVPSILRMLWSTTHHQPFGLCEDDVVLEYRVNKRFDVLLVAPPGRAIFLALPILLRVLPFEVDHGLQHRCTYQTHHQVERMKTRQDTFVGQTKVHKENHEPVHHGIAIAMTVEPCGFLHHTLNKFLTIKDKHILLYEHNAFTSYLMLDSDEVYQMTKRGLDAAQISAAKRIHLNLVLVKLLELHHLGYDLRHYHAQHHAFIKQFNLPAHFQFDVATD